MKVSIAQTRPVKGNIEENLENHLQFIEKATRNEADIIVFPELSLTGYEQDLARQLAKNKADKRFEIFQKISDTKKITICAGIPTIDNENIFITMLIFSPNAKIIQYSKQYLYETEAEIFTEGNNPIVLPFDGKNIVAPAICYETSIEEHAQNAHEKNANIYIASVLNSVNGIDKDVNRISNIAKQYNMTAFMANYTGQSGGYECAGKSTIWNDKGQIIAQLGRNEEAVLVYNTETEEIIKEVVNSHYYG
ncbi:carbon-nitrogen hydrolase family protein [Flavobacterium salmonis]|uniref:Omega-amidase YafV n=1 Tax=Flavobacterium salmonis TaxID=2654844 RepID=A0A6V6ZBR2_9FLAO|nr:carbon-nitrogen hydrolase family protein [Flavobacterium salmonis]CAD0009247.1 Omega-amidase YafV [Flavobacterium salmonis]